MKLTLNRRLIRRCMNPHQWRIDEKQFSSLLILAMSCLIVWLIWSKRTSEYDASMPIIFVGGVPRSGTTLMRAMLDAHPSIRCGEETHLVPNILGVRRNWMGDMDETGNKTQHETIARNKERLLNAGITADVFDSAISKFVLELIVKHGKWAPRLCNKDPLVLSHSIYVKKRLFPNSKFILMIRDGRASVHSMISRKVGVGGFNLKSYKDSMKSWNKMIERMYAQCVELGRETCLPVYYEQLVLHPESEMRKILQFLGVKWNDAVLHHEDFIGDEVKLSKTEPSTDQVVKPVNLLALTEWAGKIPDDVLAEMDNLAPMLKLLGYDPFANPPNYGDSDLRIKLNTLDVERNKEYWKSIAKKHSVNV